jgi:predicted DNA-binding transcriptional regulator AlpA
MTEQTTAVNRMVYKKELQASTGVSADTIRRWVRSGKLPKPDVQNSAMVVGWKHSTFCEAGINLP